MSQIMYKLRLLFGRREITVLDGSSVNAIAEMQKKIDAYEDYIILLSGMVQRKNTSVKSLLHDTPLDGLMHQTWLNVIELIKNEKKNSNEGTDRNQ